MSDYRSSRVSLNSQMFNADYEPTTQNENSQGKRKREKKYEDKARESSLTILKSIDTQQKHLTSTMFHQIEDMEERISNNLGEIKKILGENIKIMKENKIIKETILEFKEDIKNLKAEFQNTQKRNNSINEKVLKSINELNNNISNSLECKCACRNMKMEINGVRKQQANGHINEANSIRSENESCSSIIFVDGSKNLKVLNTTFRRKITSDRIILDNKVSKKLESSESSESEKGKSEELKEPFSNPASSFNKSNKSK